MDEKRKRLKLDPDLADGQHWTVYDPDEKRSPLEEQLRAWLEEARPGETLTIEAVEMTDAEVEALPDI